MDILAAREVETLGVEVETGRSDLRAKLSDYRSLPADRVVVLTLTQPVAERVEASAMRAGPNGHRVAVLTVKDLFWQPGATAGEGWLSNVSGHS